MNGKSIDIVLVNYNTTEIALRCIESVYRNIEGYDKKVFVVDNDSNDHPENIIAKYPEIVLITNKKNYGFSKAANYAIKKGSSRYIVLLNPDTCILNNSFNLIIRYMDENEEVAISGPMVLDPDGSVQGSARRFPTFWTSFFGRKSPITRLLPNNSFTRKEFFCFNGNHMKIQSVDWVSGACMVLRREAVISVGGFDETFFLYWEDTDLCTRLRHYGWKIVYYPLTRVMHTVGESSNTCPIYAIYHFHKSSFILFNKYVKWPAKGLMPYIILGLSIRFAFVVALNIAQQMLSRDRRSFQGQIKDKKSNREISVLRFVSRLNIGGPSIHCAILQQGLDKRLFKTKLIAGTVSPTEGDMSYLISNNGGSFIKIPELQREVNFIQDITAFLKVSSFIFRIKPDIVHTHMAKAGALARAAVFIHNLLSTKKIRTVHTFHGHVLDGYFSKIQSRLIITVEKLLAKITDAIIAISQTQKWELSQKYKIATHEKIFAINLGFDLNKFAVDRNKGVFRTKIGVGENDILVGIIGRLVPIKNHILFLNSAKLIKERHPERNIKFLIVGNGELREKLENLAHSLGIQRDVIFYGWTKNVRKIYSDLDILLLTSDNEGTPVSLIESMASYVPVVTTGVGGVKDLLGSIVNGNLYTNDFVVCERGILCPKGNPEALANGVAFILEHDNRERIVRAHDFVFKNYSDRKLIQNIECLYKFLLS